MADCVPQICTTGLQPSSTSRVFKLSYFMAHLLSEVSLLLLLQVAGNGSPPGEACRDGKGEVGAEG